MGLFKTIKGALGVFAPTLASALPGPLGGMAKAAITKVLGLDPGSSNDQIEQALAQADPAALERLRKIDAEFKTTMRAFEVDIERINADDRGSARSREIAIRDGAPKILAAVTVTGWMGLTAALFKYTIPESNNELILICFGILSTAVVGIYNYYFGSSAGSARKTEIMNGGKK